MGYDKNQKMMRMNEKGFTIIEIISVLVLIGVLSAIVLLSRSSGDVDMAAGYDTLKVHLRYAQMRSMNSDVIWGVQFSGSSYGLVRDIAGSPSARRFPGESGLSVSLPTPVTGTVQFDAWGRPTGLGSISLGGNTITITPDTGFIP